MGGGGPEGSKPNCVLSVFDSADCFSLLLSFVTVQWCSVRGQGAVAPGAKFKVGTQKFPMKTLIKQGIINNKIG